MQTRPLARQQHSVRKIECMRVGSIETKSISNINPPPSITRIPPSPDQVFCPSFRRCCATRQTRQIYSRLAANSLSATPLPHNFSPQPPLYRSIVSPCILLQMPRLFYSLLSSSMRCSSTPSAGPTSSPTPRADICRSRTLLHCRYNVHARQRAWPEGKGTRIRLCCMWCSLITCFVDGGVGVRGGDG